MCYVLNVCALCSTLQAWIACVCVYVSTTRLEFYFSLQQDTSAFQYFVQVSFWQCAASKVTTGLALHCSGIALTVPRCICCCAGIFENFGTINVLLPCQVEINMWFQVEMNMWLWECLLLSRCCYCDTRNVILISSGDLHLVCQIDLNTVRHLREPCVAYSQARTLYCQSQLVPWQLPDLTKSTHLPRALWTSWGLLTAMAFSDVPQTCRKHSSFVACFVMSDSSVSWVSLLQGLVWLCLTSSCGPDDMWHSKSLSPVSSTVNSSITQTKLGTIDCLCSLHLLHICLTPNVRQPAT